MFFTFSESVSFLLFRSDILPAIGVVVYLFLMYKLFDSNIKKQEKIRQLAMEKAELEGKYEDLMVRHDEELQLEKIKSTSFFLKMRMNYRDCMSKVGGAKRKLKEKNGLVNQLTEKVSELRWVEDDAKEMLDEIEKSRVTIREQKETVEKMRTRIDIVEKSYSKLYQTYCEKVKELEKLRDEKERRHNENKENIRLID